MSKPVITIEGCSQRVRRRLAIEIQTALDSLGLRVTRVGDRDDQEPTEPQNDETRFAEMEKLRARKAEFEVWGIPKARRRRR